MHIYSQPFYRILFLRMRLQVIIILVLILNSCGFFRAPGKDKCDKIISSEKMTALLGDVYLMEAYVSNNINFGLWTNDSAISYYGGLFEKHGVSKHAFEQALYCYLLNERDITKIHEEILNRFSIMQSQSERLMLDEHSVEGDTIFDADGTAVKDLSRHRWRFIIPEITSLPSDTL